MQELSYGELLQAFPVRDKRAHKGEFGQVAVIGGNFGMAGAPILAAMASCRVGAGIVKVLTRPEHTNTVIALSPVLQAHGVSTSKQLSALLDKITVLVVGPGLGQDDWAVKLFDYVIKKTELPMVLDADGLRLLAEHPSKSERWVLTPHVGEAAHMLGVSTHDIQADRAGAVQALQKKYGGVAILKGNGTLISAAKATSICNAGNPGMATGGMGDVLAGTIGGLLAQHLDLLNAAQLGVMMHALAGDLAAKDYGERGMIATDILPYLRHLANQAVG